MSHSQGMLDTKNSNIMSHSQGKEKSVPELDALLCKV